MTHVEPRARGMSRPRLDCWNLATATSGLRIFQSLGCVCTLFLIASVGSHFSPTYAALATSTIAAIVGTTLLVIFAFNLHTVTSSVDWIFWESLYSGSFAFLFMVNSITMIYSSLRWQYTAWWLGTVACILVAVAFLIDLIILVRLQLTNPSCRHSQDDLVIRRTDQSITYR